MARFVGVKDQHICIVSDKPFVNDAVQILEVPSELSDLSATELIIRCKVKDGVFKCKGIKKPAIQMKVAFITNYRMRCGLSTYIENLIPEMAPHIGHFKLFIERNDDITGDIFQVGSQKLLPDRVISCWKRGESLQELIDAIKKYDPDVILINHEFGLFPNARHWLSLMTQLSDYRVIVIMHSIFPDHYDKMVYEASMPEIVVHLEGAKDNLQNTKKVNAKVHVIHHGCYPISERSKLWNNYKSQHTFIRRGFLFRYKGWSLALETAAILKEKYPDVFFTGLCSESPYAIVEHQLYYDELMHLIDHLGLKDNVAMIKGYQSDNIIDAYLRSNKVAIFPYVSSNQHKVFGASGAARLAMSKGLPVITSLINHFIDLPTIKVDSPQQMADELDRLFSDPIYEQQQIKKQNTFVEENSWENTAKKYIEVLENY